MNETKPIAHSKTLWFNLLIAVFMVLFDHVDLLKTYLSDGGYLAVMMAVSAGNIYLRALTNTGVRLK